MRGVSVSAAALEAVRSLDGRSSPLGTDNFVGRDPELAELLAAISSGARRIWIGGASGLGKTALLRQLALRLRETALPYAWLGSHEPATPSALRAIADELASTGAAGHRRVLVVDDFARLRPIEPWFVERFLPSVAMHITVVVADRSAAPVWRTADHGLVLDLAPLSQADAHRYLEHRGVPDRLHDQIVALAEGIPGVLAASADAHAIRSGDPFGDALIDDTAMFHARYDSDGHRLAIA